MGQPVTVPGWSARRAGRRDDVALRQPAFAARAVRITRCRRVPRRIRARRPQQGARAGRAGRSGSTAAAGPPPFRRVRRGRWRGWRPARGSLAPLPGSRHGRRSRRLRAAFRRRPVRAVPVAPGRCPCVRPGQGAHSYVHQGTRIDLNDQARAIGTQIAAVDKGFLPFERARRGHQPAPRRLRAPPPLARAVARDRRRARHRQAAREDPRQRLQVHPRRSRRHLPARRGRRAHPPRLASAATARRPPSASRPRS